MFSFLFIQKKTVSVLKIVFYSIQQYWLAKKKKKKNSIHGILNMDQL